MLGTPKLADNIQHLQIVISQLVPISKIKRTFQIGQSCVRVNASIRYCFIILGLVNRSWDQRRRRTSRCHVNVNCLRSGSLAHCQPGVLGLQRTCHPHSGWQPSRHTMTDISTANCRRRRFLASYNISITLRNYTGLQRINHHIRIVFRNNLLVHRICAKRLWWHAINRCHLAIQHTPRILGRNTISNVNRLRNSNVNWATSNTKRI